MIYLLLFLTFFKIGAFTFGGGYAMLPLIQEQVARHGWLTEEELINFVAVSESTPGPFAINVSTYVGMETGGFFGAFCATLGVVLPSFIVILIVARIYEKFKESAIVKGAMSGLKPAVVGLIGAAIVSAGKAVLLPSVLTWEALSDISFWGPVCIFLVCLPLVLHKKLHPIFIILLSAIGGILLGFIQGKL